MNLPVLKYFIVVSECRNFTKAAERLFITQPTLSRQIQELEKEMGTPLLQRNGRSLMLTDAGKRFLKEAKEIVRRCDSLQDSLKQEDQQQISGSLRISYLEDFDTTGMLSALSSFAKKYPNVNLVLGRSKYVKLQQDLAAGRCDLAFTLRIYAQDIPDSSYLLLEKTKLQIAVPKQHPLATRKNVDIEELAAEKFIIMERKNAPLTVDLIMDLCIRSGFSPNTSQYTSDIGSALMLVSMGKGISFLFSSMNVNTDQVCVLDVKGNHDIFDQVAAYTKTDNPLIDLLLQEIRE